MKKCKRCNCDLISNRMYCEECQKVRKREYAKQRYKLMLDEGKQKKRYGIGICIYCGKEFIKNHFESYFIK